MYAFLYRKLSQVPIAAFSTVRSTLTKRTASSKTELAKKEKQMKTLKISLVRIQTRIKIGRQ